MKVGAFISVIVLSAALTPAMAVECITADQLSANGPGPYAGGDYPLDGTRVQVWMGPYVGPGGSVGSSMSPEIVPNTCGGSNQFALKTGVSDLYAVLRDPLVNITVTFCDGADQNNLSARVSSIDFIGPAQDAHGKTLPGPFGTSAAVSVQPAPNGSGQQIQLGGHIFQFVFGGTETMILEVCGQR